MCSWYIQSLWRFINLQIHGREKMDGERENLALNKNKRTTELEAYQSLQAEAFEQTYVNKNTKGDKGSFVDIKKNIHMSFEFSFVL